MRGQKGGLRDWLITNKIINLNIKKRKKLDEEHLQASKKEELKKSNQVIQKQDNKLPLKVSSITKLRLDKKGIDIVSQDLEDVIVIKEEDIENINYDATSPEITVISKKEVIKLKEKIKVGINQVQKEESIEKKVNTIIAKAKEEIKKVDKEIKEVEKEIKEEYDTNKITKHEQKLLNIQLKIDQIKRKYNVILDNTDFLYFDELNDEKLLEEISDYKFITDSSEMITSLAHDCRNQLDEIVTIFDTYEKKKNLDKSKDIKKKELQDRDDKFNAHKKRVITIDEINKQIKEKFEGQQQFILNLQNKIDKTENKFKDVIRLRGLNKMSYNLMKISFLIYAVKEKKMALAAALLLFDHVVKNMNNSLVEKQKQKAVNQYKQLTDELSDGKKELGSITNLLSDSLYQVEKLKEEFKLKFSDYQDVLPEYYNISKRLDLIIEQLKIKDEQVKKTENKLNEQYEKNKVKIKRMEAA